MRCEIRETGHIPICEFGVRVDVLTWYAFGCSGVWLGFEIGAREFGGFVYRISYVVNRNEISIRKKFQ